MDATRSASSSPDRAVSASMSPSASVPARPSTLVRAFRIAVDASFVPGAAGAVIGSVIGSAVGWRRAITSVSGEFRTDEDTVPPTNPPTEPLVVRLCTLCTRIPTKGT